MFEMRKSGILLHISSLPSDYGIGTMGRDAYKFVDFLKRSGQRYWQILPIGPTSFGDSPYQSPSTYAGNSYFIDLDMLKEDGLLKEEDYSCLKWGQEERKVDYETIYVLKDKVLRIAYKNGFKRDSQEVDKFVEDNGYWVNDYALFMAIKKQNGMRAYTTWELPIRRGEPCEVKRLKELLKEEINYNIYVQYLFFKQWNKLKSYANKNGIKIIGDIPIYVAEDSVDTWANPEIFALDENRIPIKVSGCPPDAFTEDGQLWGNPIYNWDVLESTDFKWWIDRIRGAARMYDIIRVDHFRAFSSYYCIEYGRPNARIGEWIPVPGRKLFEKVKQELPEVRIIAEDLGFITDDVRNLMDFVGFPGMKILIFGFGDDGESDFIPYKIQRNSVAYIGTHDNETFMGWIKNASPKEIELAKSYMNLTEEEGYNWGAVRTLFESQADTTIVQLQDLLGLNNEEGRMNVPGIVGGNWVWRALKDDFTDDLSEKLYRYTKMFGRLNKS